MAAISHDCPHCGTKRVAFEVLGGFVYDRDPEFEGHPKIEAFVKCGSCRRGATALFAARNRARVGDAARNFADAYEEYWRDFYLLEFHPRPAMPEEPQHLPDNVRTFYLEGVENVKAGPNAAGAMFRKALDVGLRAIDRDAKGNLNQRINAAAEAGKITEELGEWSHHIRLEGNDASHDEDPFTQEEAEHLHRFTELVMMYLFTLPGMLEARRAGGAAKSEKAKEIRHRARII